jgi:hypothetical protein
MNLNSYTLVTLTLSRPGHLASEKLTCQRQSVEID